MASTARSGNRVAVTSDAYAEVFSSKSNDGNDGPGMMGVLFVAESKKADGSDVTGGVTVEVTGAVVEEFTLQPGDSHPITSADINTKIKRVRVKRAATGVDGSITWRQLVV